jgi:hypothetical protein
MKKSKFAEAQIAFILRQAEKALKYGCGRITPNGDDGIRIMKKIAVILPQAFAFITGMAVVTVVAHTDQAVARGG